MAGSCIGICQCLMHYGWCAMKNRVDGNEGTLQVEAMRRRDLYGREQLLGRIREDTERAHELLSQRTALQEQRKLANMGSSFQRQKLMQARDLPLASGLQKYCSDIPLEDGWIHCCGYGGFVAMVGHIAVSELMYCSSMMMSLQHAEVGPRVSADTISLSTRRKYF